MKKSNSSYHHGNLREAILQAAITMVRETGVESVGLREVARRVGVTATATYRHFPSLEALLGELKCSALTLLYETMMAEIEKVPEDNDATQYALQRLRAVGYGYVSFAQEEPGLFRAAFAHRVPLPEKMYLDPAETDPYILTASLVNELAETGYLPQASRPYAEIALWASVHGISMLLVDGPLAQLPQKEREAAIAKTIDTALKGL